MTSSYKTITAIIARTANSKNATVLTWFVDLSEEINHWCKVSTNYPQRIKMEKEQKHHGICPSTYIHSKTAKMTEMNTNFCCPTCRGNQNFENSKI